MKFCEQCGTQLSDEAQFCPACGQASQTQKPPQTPVQQTQSQWAQPPRQIQPQAPAAPQPKKASKGSGRALFLLLGVVAAGAVIAALLAAGVLQLGTTGGSAAGTQVEGPGYASAEDAALAYAEALKAGDMGAMLSTFAVESYAEHFDAAVYWEDMRAVQFSIFSGGTLLAEDNLALAINSEARRAQIVQWIYFQYLNPLLAGTEYDDKVVVPFQAPEDMDDLMRLLRQEPGFANMKIGAALSPEDILDEERMEAYAEAHQTNKDRRAQWYGAQDIRDICLELTIDGEDYYLVISTIRYDGKWYNESLYSLLSAYLGADGMSGGLIPMDEIEN